MGTADGVYSAVVGRNTDRASNIGAWRVVTSVRAVTRGNENKESGSPTNPNSTTTISYQC